MKKKYERARKKLKRNSIFKKSRRFNEGIKNQRNI